MQGRRGKEPGESRPCSPWSGFFRPWGKPETGDGGWEHVTSKLRVLNTHIYALVDSAGQESQHDRTGSSASGVSERLQLNCQVGLWSHLKVQLWRIPSMLPVLPPAQGIGRSTPFWGLWPRDGCSQQNWEVSSHPPRTPKPTSFLLPPPGSPWFSHNLLWVPTCFSTLPVLRAPFPPHSSFRELHGGPLSPM